MRGFLLTTVAAISIAAFASAQRPELHGTVQSAGEALRGATVFVYTAKPKHGTSPI